MAGGAAQRRERVLELLDMVALGPEYRRPASARALGRPAPACRHRARALGRAGAARRRRAGLGARRVDPGADRQPARRAEAAPEPRDAVHLARHRRDGASLRPHRDRLSRPHHGDRADARADRRAAPSLHRGAAVGGARARREAARTDRADRATCRTRPIRRAAACSAPAAATRCRPARPSAPPLRPVGPEHHTACIRDDVFPSHAAPPRARSRSHEIPVSAGG